MQKKIMFNNQLCIRQSIRMVYFSVHNQTKKKFQRRIWFTYSDIHRLCSLHTSVKGGSDMAKKMLKALKINTIEICKYPFNVNGSVKHICICSYSWSHLILSKDFPPLFVYPLPYYCDHLLSRSRSSEVFNTWNLYPFMQRCVPLVRTERKVESLFFLMLVTE